MMGDRELRLRRFLRGLNRTCCFWFLVGERLVLYWSWGGFWSGLKLRFFGRVENKIVVLEEGRVYKRNLVRVGHVLSFIIVITI